MLPVGGKGWFYGHWKFNYYDSKEMSNKNKNPSINKVLHLDTR